MRQLPTDTERPQCIDWFVRTSEQAQPRGQGVELDNGPRFVVM